MELLWVLVVTKVFVAAAVAATLNKTASTLDMQVSHKTQYKRSIGEVQYRWPGGVLYYKITEGFTQQQLALIEQAKHLISSRTENCITFKEFTYSQGIDYLEIKRTSEGCGSQVGRQGGVQYLRLADECFANGYGVIAHEIMHILGFFHEHVREDRNDHITVHEELISQSKLSEFEILPFETFDIPYDYDSILHYPRESFGISGIEETITPKDPNIRIGQRDHLSDGDVARVKYYYACGTG